MAHEKNQEIETAINEHLKQKLQEDLSVEDSHALRIKVSVIRELATE